MWRFERLERRPANDPDPVTHIYRVTVRNDDGGALSTVDFPCPSTEDTTELDFRTEFQDQFGALYVPNDWAPL